MPAEEGLYRPFAQERSLVNCPRCSGENRDGAVLCWSCGGTLPSAPQGMPAGSVVETRPLQEIQAEQSVRRGANLTEGNTRAEAEGSVGGVERRAIPTPGAGGTARPYARPAPAQTSQTSSGWAPQAPAEWIPEPADLGPLMVGPTTIGLMLLAAALLVGGAATPLVVATALDQIGSATTILRYSVLDSAAAAAAGVLVLLGRRRGWTILRLLVVATVLVGYLIWRYFTFGSIPIDPGPLAIQQVRLGPGWYLAALGTIFVGAAFFSAVRGHF